MSQFPITPQSKGQLKGNTIILGTSSPIILTPLKEREKNILPSQKPDKKRKSIVKKRWKPKRVTNNIKELKAFQESQKKARTYGMGVMKSPLAGRKAITYAKKCSGGAFEMNRRKH